MSRNRQNAEIERSIRAATRQEIEFFHQYKPALEEKIRAGMLSYVVEWWETDEYYLDENAHMFFLFRDDEEQCYDIVLHMPIHDELKALLTLAGISWEWHYEHEFCSRILYPAELAGQPWYEKAPLPRRQWWERLFDILTFTNRVQWVRRKDLP